MSSNTSGDTVSVTTSIATFTSTLESSTITSESTITTSSIITTSLEPSTTTELPSTSSAPPTSSEIPITSTIPPPSSDPTQAPSIVVVTSTLPPSQPPPPSTTTSSSTSTSSSSSPSALSADSDGSGDSGGLSKTGRIAIAVVIPLVVVAGLIVFGIWFWRKRKAKKNAQELRKNEMAEYGFNPNSDPTLAPPVAAAAYAEDASDGPEDNSGYRGWGATSSNRKASTTLGSGGRPVGLAVSDNGSQPGGYPGSSPATNPSDHYSGDPLINGHPERVDNVSALGAGAAVGAAAVALARNRSGNNGDIRRGPSNASSAYSNGPPQSEASSDVPDVPGHYYEQEVPYNVYNDPQSNMGGPYGDGTYGGSGAQPVIRDVQARRNTRIERAPTMPQTQGGISQNF